LLPRIVGFSQTARLLFSGEVIDAQEMLRIGLVDEVVADDQLRERAVAVARHLASGAPAAVAHMKRQMYETLHKHPLTMYIENSRAFKDSMETEDFKEGVAAFLEKRPPRWTGR
jgi:enoyl-CoA hydratase/carnithine racemase